MDKKVYYYYYMSNTSYTLLSHERITEKVEQLYVLIVVKS